MDLPSGTRNLSYPKDMAIVRTRLQWGLVVVAALVLFVIIPFTGSEHILSIMNSAIIIMITVMGLNILTGYTGQISLGQSAFMAVGAYTTAIFAVKYNLPFWITLPSAGLMSGAMGLIFGLPALRIKGFYLAMATLAVQFIVVYIIYIIPELTGGSEGMSVPSPRLGSVSLHSPKTFYYLCTLITVLMTFLSVNLGRTKTGRSFIAIRDNDLAAEVMGVSLFSNRLLAFFICSFYAGVSGGLFAYHVRYVHPDYFTLTNSIWYLGMLIVGGLGSSLGAILGTMFLKGLEELVTIAGPMVTSLLEGTMVETGAASAVVLMFQALVIMLFLVFEPRGLAHRWDLLKSSYRLWPFSYPFT